MKLRVISGSLGGRLINSPPGNKTHPMSEKMRGAIFNILGNIEGLDVLDAYSGSGAIALEAISRKAKSVIAIETDKKAIETIRNNISSLDVPVKATQANISTWIDNNLNQQFDIIIADPPYEKINLKHLNKLSLVLRMGGILVLSLAPEYSKIEIENCQMIEIKSYGDSCLVFFRRLG